MPPRGRKRRGKELVAAVATDAPGDAAAAVSPEYVEAVVAELEHESERRVKKLKRQMGDMRQEFLNHFQVELLKIPRKIREMKVEHFSSEYGGSMEEALKKAAQSTHSALRSSHGPGNSCTAPASLRSRTHSGTGSRRSFGLAKLNGETLQHHDGRRTIDRIVGPGEEAF